MKYIISVKEYSEERNGELLTASSVEKGATDNFEQAKKMLFSATAELINNNIDFSEGRFNGFRNFYEYFDEFGYTEDDEEFKNENQEVLNKIEDFIGEMANGKTPVMDLSKYDVYYESLEDIEYDVYGGILCKINNDGFVFGHDYLNLTCNMHDVSDKNKNYYFRICSFYSNYPISKNTKSVIQVQLTCL